MFTRVCLVHYHEIGLKGKNRYVFENQLKDNLKFVLQDYPVSEVIRISGHLRVRVDEPSYLNEIADLIKQTPGVARVSLAWLTDRVVDEFNQAAALAMKSMEPFHSFKVHAKRSNTNFDISSMELNQLVGAYLCEKFPDKKVQMKNPDVEVVVMVSQGSGYIFAESYPGVGGLPVGSAGKVVSLLSSGIDSPVASYKMLKRGAVVVPIHFSGRPQTSDASEFLVKDIAEKLNKQTGGIGRLYIVPFGEYQREIALKVDPDLRIIMYRRLMFLVANKIAELEKAKALVTGESLGQVASQTLENIMAVDEMSELPVFRPLIGSDKLEIIEVAQKVGTFEISSQDAPDCCTLFMPRNPQTHANLKIVHEQWSTLPIEDYVKEIMDKLEYIQFDSPVYKVGKIK